MRWNTFYKSIGPNLAQVRDRFEDPNLHSNQVILTDEYDDGTSDEEISGYDFEAKRQAEEEKKKDAMANMMNKMLFK